MHFHLVVACIAASVCSNLLVACLGSAAEPRAAAQGADGTVWQVILEDTIPSATRRTNIVGRYAVVTLNKPALDRALVNVPREVTGPTQPSTTLLALPLPDGRFTRFRVVQTSTLAPELAAAFPEMKTYSGIGIDDPTASTSFGWTAIGFHAVILAAGGSVYIDPYSPGDLSTYVVYRDSDLRNDRKVAPR